MADGKSEKYIDAAAADRLIAAHDGDVALYAIYTARHPGADDETAAAALCRTLGEIAAAREKLERLLPGAAPRQKKPLFPEDGPIQYPTKEIVGTFEKDAAFSSLVDELARILGATPSGSYLNALVDAYEHLGMPPEVLMLLLHHCDDEIRRRWGSQRKPTAKYISDEAYRWANREIMTMELAEEYIARCEKRREEKSRAAELLGIRGRGLSPTETKYVESWLDMGFDDGALAAALDRTLTNTGSLRWAYMNGILNRWHAKGLHTAEEVERAEGRHGKENWGAGRIEQIDENELAETIERITGGRK